MSFFAGISPVPGHDKEPFVLQRTIETKKAVRSSARTAEPSEFVALCKPHEEKIFQIVLRITRNTEDAEDALQDALYSAFVHWHEFDSRSTFSTWLTRIAINSALMILRKRHSSRMISWNSPADAQESFLDPADHSPNPELAYLQRERERALHGVLRSLRPSLRQVIEIQQLQERPMKEAAQLMGVSVAALKGRLFHAKAALRRSHALKRFASNRGAGFVETRKAANARIF